LLFSCVTLYAFVVCIKPLTYLLTYLEIWLRGHSRSLKVVPLESLGAVSYSLSTVTMTVSVAVCDIFSIKEWCDLENRVRAR